MLPGFVGGVVFFALVGFGARSHKATEGSFSAVIVCGAMAGLFLGVMPFAINEPPAGSPVWLVAAVVIGAMTLMSTISAAGSIVLARATTGSSGSVG
jgi:hypothetical protein